jgi:ligand-binding sensor domain-containing protein/signal transduction histidine kinase
MRSTHPSHSLLRVLPRLACALIAITFLLGSLPGQAQAQSETIRFDTLSVENGLSQGTVRAILQDSRGFLWLGTDDGLNKYDGYTFTLYKHDAGNQDSIADNMITALYEDRAGDLWIGTGNGLDRMDREAETFEHFQHDPGRFRSLQGTVVSAIMEDQQGSLWIGTTEGGLNMLNREDASFTSYLHTKTDPDSLASDDVRALLADPDGGLWIGTSRGLDYFEPQSGKFRHYRGETADEAPLNNNRILSLFRDRAGNLWVGTEESGLYRINPSSRSSTHFQNRPDNPYSLSSNFIRAIYEDQSGRLWIGGRDGLNLYRSEGDYFNRYQHDPNDSFSLSNDYILSIYVDRSGVLWVGTYGGGLNKYVQNNERFTLYQHRSGVPTSLSNDIIYAIHEDREGIVWVGTMEGGLNRLDKEALTFSAFQNEPDNPDSLSSNDVRAILEDRLGVLWVGTNGGGLNRFDRDTNTFSHFWHNTGDTSSLSDDRVMSLYEDRRGNLWVGTRAGGLDLMDRETGHFTHFIPIPDNSGGGFVRAITEDHAGNLWVGTNGGIAVMDPNTRRFYQTFQNDPRNPQSLSDNRVLSIQETQDNGVWVGTLLGGLNRFDPNTRTFQHYTQKDGLPGDTVFGILVDRSGYLWLSTNRGLSRFDPRTEAFRNYDRRDGLQSYEFNAGAYFQNSRGRMYFGGIQGFNAFDPTQVKDNPLPPQVVITAFKKFNQIEAKDITGNEKFTLPYQGNFISFEFAALDFSAPEKNQYAYKLEGFDKDWVYAGARRYASYTNLRGGKYVFQVIGSNQDGVWNEKGASVEITVVPPFWESGWFITSAVLIAAGLIFGIYRLRVMQIQSTTRNLEEQVLERTQEIERRREVAEGLRETLTILNSNRSLKESLDAIILQIVRLMDARVVIIFRFEEDDYPTVVATNLHPNFDQSREQTLPPMPDWLVQPLLKGLIFSQPDLVVQRQSDPDLAGSFFGHYSALLAAPLFVSDKVDGGLVLLYSWAREFTEEDFQMVTSFSNHAAMAIANAQLRSQAEESAVSAERSRLARDLHDAVTQTLFATSLIAEVLPKLWERNPEAGKQKVTEIRELTRGALAEMRTLLMELRPTALVDVPLPDLLQQLSEAFIGRARVPVLLDVSKDIILPSNVKIGFYRIAQEALNNIQKHSRATQVEMQMHHQDGLVEMSIQDNGIGFDRHIKLPDHFGLGIMEERAQSIDAQFSLESQPGKGTKITVCWKRM